MTKLSDHQMEEVSALVTLLGLADSDLVQEGIAQFVVKHNIDLRNIATRCNEIALDNIPDAPRG